MRIYKKLKGFISLVCAIAMLLSVCAIPVAATDGKTVTATTSTSVKQGNTGTCYVYINSTESLAALDVTVHFDPAKVKINSIYNSVSCAYYESAKNTDNIKFNYLFSGSGSSSQTRLFYFSYQVLSNAEVGDTSFDITVGEAYDSALNEVAVSGSRCSFTITETVTNKTCSVSSTSTVSTSVEKEFSLSYSFSTYQISSGAAVVTYDPELFEVVSVTEGQFLGNKASDINTELSGAVYIAFTGVYNTKRDLVTVKFKTLKNVTESSKITFKATELYDIDANPISCSDYVTTANVAIDNTYIGDAPNMSVSAEYDSSTKKITAVITMEKDSRFGAGDFVVGFDPDMLKISSYEKGFEPDHFNVIEKETASGKLKLSIFSYDDIVTAEKIITVVFDVLQPCIDQQIEITIDGSVVTDSLGKLIPLNYIDDSVSITGKHSYTDSSDLSCNECDYVRPQSVDLKGATLEYKDIIYVKMIYDLVGIDPNTIDLTKDAGLLWWTQEEFAALDGIEYDEDHALAGLELYPNTSFYYGKSNGIIARYLAEEYYFVGYVKLPDGTYVYSNASLYGPKTYAYNMIGKENTKEKTKNLCIALLNYATAAQKYFGTEGVGLANAGLTEEQKAMNWNSAEEYFNLSAEIPDDKKVTADTSVFSRCGRNLRFKEMISLIAIYQIDPSIIASATETGTIFWTAEQFAALNGTPSLDNYGQGKKVVGLEKYSGTNVWCSVAPAVAPKDISDTYYYILGYVKHSDGTVSYSELMSYTFEQYIYNTTNNPDSSEKMIELSKRLYYYERAAKAALK